MNEHVFYPGIDIAKVSSMGGFVSLFSWQIEMQLISPSNTTRLFTPKFIAWLIVR